MPEDPPKLAERLLRWLVGGRDADAVAGDLRESFAARGGGRFWYWRQAMSCVAVRLSPSRRMLPGLSQDFHHALRMIRRNPGYAFTAMLCLALAMGVNTILFSFLDSMFFRKLPVPDAGRIVQVHRAKTPFCTWREYLDFRDGLRSLQAASVSRFGGVARVDGIYLPMASETVSANFASVLRLGTTLGRWFTPEEDSPSSEPVIVIGYNLWEAKLHRDPAIIGKQMRFDDMQSFRIVGVAPQRFAGVIPPIAADAWVPEASLQNLRGGSSGRKVNLIARLAPGATLETATAEMRVMEAGLGAVDRGDPRSSDPVRVEDTSGFFTGYRSPFKPLLWIMSVVSGMVLLIACVNVANLLLSRAAVRRREMALRQSLGASRARLLREQLTEGLVLAAGGVALGIFFGYWTGRALELALHGSPGPGAFYQGIQLEIDWRVALFLGAAGAASAILFSLPPALENSRRDLGPALNGADRGRASRQRELYSLAQVALSLTLLVATGLLLRALERVENIEPGFAVDHRLYVELSAAPSIRAQTAAAQLFSYVLEQARALPGVEDATLSNAFFGFYHSGCGSTSSGAAPRRLGANTVEPNYFEMMRVPIVQGRGFGPGGTPGEPPSIVVNETMARTWWPGESAIGKSLWVGCDRTKRQMGEVIGIARDSKYIALGDPQEPFYYVSRRQDAGDGYFTLTIRTAGNPYLWAKPLLKAVQGAGPNLRIYETDSLENTIALSLWEVKWQAALLGSVGLLAIVLAAIGLYGVVAYAVSQRTREIGVRMAMGATPGDVQWMVLGRGLRITAAGIAGGLLLSAATVHWLRSYLYGLSPFDPIAFAGASLAWVIIAMLASWYPARRATRVDPLTALKYE